VNRRVPILVAAVAAVAVLSSCSTFDDTAAKVGPTKISGDAFGAIVDAFEDVCTPATDPAECDGKITPQVLSDLQLRVAEGPGYDGDAARFWLGYLVRQQLATITLARLGGAITPDDQQQAQAAIDADTTVSLFPEALKSEIVTSVAVQNAITRIASVPTPAELESRYSADPASTGALCLRHILVPTLAEAQDIEARLAEGEAFADLAAKFSTDTVSAAAGGALGSDEAPCNLLAELVGNFDPRFLQGALHAKPGVPTEPVRSSFGWHIILARPYSEVADGLPLAVGTDPYRAALYADFTTVPVSVNSRYGQWDPVQVQLVPNV